MCMGNQQYRLRNDLFRCDERYSCFRYRIYNETNRKKAFDDIRFLYSHGNFYFPVALETHSWSKSNILFDVWIMGSLWRYVAGTNKRWALNNCKSLSFFENIYFQSIFVFLYLYHLSVKRIALYDDTSCWSSRICTEHLMAVYNILYIIDWRKY